jgi:hypothetical protein
MRSSIGKFALLLLPSLLLGCATMDELHNARAERRAERTVRALLKASDADSLAAAGLLSSGSHGGQSQSLLSRASATAPERADLVWLQAQVCLKQPPCDPEPMERRLRSLDPSNGAAWLGALSRADASRDESNKEASLAAIGRSARVDIYWTTLVSHLSGASADTSMMSLEEAEITVIGFLAAQSIPAYELASKSCSGDRLERADILEVCRGVARAFEAGDSYLTQMIGTRIALRVWPEGSPDWKAATEARRLYTYRSKLVLDKDADSPNHRTAKRYLALYAQYHREQDVYRQRLIDIGANPDPPADQP